MKLDFDEIYQPYFLKPGATLVVDFGWSDSTNSLYDVDSVIGLSDVYLDNFKNFIYGRGSNFTDFPEEVNVEMTWHPPLLHLISTLLLPSSHNLASNMLHLLSWQRASCNPTAS